MSVITKVEIPPSVKFGEPFDATIEYEPGDSKQIELTPKGTFSISPKSIHIKRDDVKVTSRLTITDEESPSRERQIKIEFKLGTSRAHAGALAKS